MTVTVTGQNDEMADGDQPYTIALGKVVSTDPSYAGQDPEDVQIANEDDGLPGFFVSVPAPGATTTEAGGTASFTVRLRSRPTADVTVAIASSKAAEGQANVTELVFTPASYATPQTVTVTGQDDVVDDGDQAYSVAVGPVTSADALYAAVAKVDVALTNTNDDMAGVMVSTMTPSYMTTERGGQVSFTVRLASAPTADVTVPVSSWNPLEGAVAPTSLVFTAANWSTAQTVTITGQNDAADDDDQGYSIVLGSAASGDPSYSGLDPNDVALVNVDDDASGISVSAPPPGSSTTEAGGQVTFSVVLTSEPSANVTIPVSSTVTAEGLADKTELVFTTANWATPQTVTVTGQGDAVVDGDQSYAITLGAATSSDVKYAGIDPADVALVNRSVCYAVKATAADARVTMPATGWGLGTSDWTLELWVKLHSDFPSPGGGKVIYMNEGYAAHNVQSMVDGQGRFFCGTYHDYCPCSKGSGNLTLWSQPIADGAWHHVACVRTGGTGTLYVDGALADTDVVDVNLSVRRIHFYRGARPGYGPSLDGDFADGESSPLARQQGAVVSAVLRASLRPPRAPRLVALSRTTLPASDRTRGGPRAARDVDRAWFASASFGRA